MLRNLSSGVISDVLFEFRRRGETTLIGAVGADVLAAGEGWERRFTFDPPLALPAALSPPDLFDMVVTFTDVRGLRCVKGHVKVPAGGH